MKVVIAAGGTGGHVYPALALAEAFRQHDRKTSITLVGAGRAVEQTMIAGMELNMETLQMRGVVGRGWVAALQALSLVPRAIWQARRLLKMTHADLVIGTGGYISPPVVLAAWWLGIKRVILEVNAIPGIANRLLSRSAQRIFVSCENLHSPFPRSKVHVVGVPIRKAFMDRLPVRTSGQIRSLLVCGGSQGAQAINTAMLAAVRDSHLIRHQMQIIHQTGADDYERVREAYATLCANVRVMPFITDMPETLRTVDLAISRCGALTLAELAACGKPAIMIPFPFATHQHQEHNARIVEQAGAGIVVRQAELTGVRLVEELETLSKDPSRVRRMAEKSFALRTTDAAETVVRECLALIAEGA